MGEEERASSVVHARYTDSISPIGHDAATDVFTR